MPKGGEKEIQANIKRYMTIMDSMTDEGKWNGHIWYFFCMSKYEENINILITYILINSNLFYAIFI